VEPRLSAGREGRGIEKEWDRERSRQGKREEKTTKRQIRQERTEKERAVS